MTNKGPKRDPGKADVRWDERRVWEVLEMLHPDCEVSLNDCRQKHGVHDLNVDGEGCEIAVEVGLVTTPDRERASSHWQKWLQPHRTNQLARLWLFRFIESYDTQAGTKKYPHTNRPNPDDLIPTLRRLDDRGIHRIFKRWQYLVRGPNGPEFADDDIAELFRLLPVAAVEGAASLDMAGTESGGGWEFILSCSDSVATEPDYLADLVERQLRSPQLSDMRRKLKMSGRRTTTAALVIGGEESPTVGFHHWGPNDVPSRSVDLPSEVNTALVVGTSNVVLTYNTESGWQRILQLTR